MKCDMCESTNMNVTLGMCLDCGHYNNYTLYVDKRSHKEIIASLEKIEQNGQIVEVNTGVSYTCPFCQKLNFADDSLRNLNKVFEGRQVKSDIIDCRYCNKEVEVIKFI